MHNYCLPKMLILGLASVLTPHPQACFTLHVEAAKQRCSITASRFTLYFHTDGIFTAAGLCTEHKVISDLLCLVFPLTTDMHYKIVNWSDSHLRNLFLVTFRIKDS